MNGSSSLSGHLGALLTEVHGRLVKFVEDPTVFARAVEKAGWVLDGSTAPPADLATSLEAAGEALDAVTSSEPSQLLDAIGALVALADAAAQLVEARDELSALLGVELAPVDAAQWSADVLNALLLELMAERARVALSVLGALGLIRTQRRAALDIGGRRVRNDTDVRVLQPELLVDLLATPEQYARTLYPIADGFSSEAGARRMLLYLLDGVRPLLAALGAAAYLGAEPSGAVHTDGGPASRERTVTIVVPVPGSAASGIVQIVVVPDGEVGRSGERGPGVEFSASGLVPFGLAVGDMVITGDVSGDSPLLFAGPERVVVPAGGSGLRADLALTKGDGSAPALRVGGLTGTRLVLGQLTLAAFVDLQTEPDFGLAIGVTGAELIVAPGDTDSFVASLLPGGGVTFDFDLELSWSRRNGLRVGTSVALELRIPVGRSIGGVVEIVAVTIGIRVDAGTLRLRSVADLAAFVGPFSVAIDGLGLELPVSFPSTGTGAAGTVDVGLSLVPPTTIVFALEGELVNGGGFVTFDPEAGRYAGGFALGIIGFGLSALVVVDTQLPDDPSGWALFASLGLELPIPVPIGFGFTLIGVGGVLALNRTIDPDELALGLASGAADAILFPDDIFRDADVLLQGLDRWLPPQSGTTTVGPVVKLGWGTPTLVTAELGVMIALPDLIFTLLGSVEVLVPIPEAPVLTLRMDILGWADTTDGTVTVVAALHDSNLLGVYELSGGMAFHADLTGMPFFVLSIGGYHPSFDPPGSVPESVSDVARIRAAIDIGSAVEVAVTGYVAITSNSFQFGGRLDIVAEADVLGTTYTAEAWFEVNLLLVLTPFKIVADATIGAAISAGDRELMGVDLAVLIEGPTPWYATGRAEFKFFGLPVTFGFDIGSRPGGQPRAPHDVAADVARALGDDSAWRAVDTGSVWASGTTLRDELPAGLWARPEQALTVRQSIAPLNRTITAFGEYVPEQSSIEVEAVTFGGAAVAAPQWLDEWFAPAQFDRLGDTARLSGPAYEVMTGGIQFGDDGVGISIDVTRECTTVSRQPEVGRGGPVLESYVSPHVAELGLPSRRHVTNIPLHLQPTRYSLIDADDATVVRGGVRHQGDDFGSEASVSYAAAVAAFEVITAGDPALATQVRISPTPSTRRR